PSRSARGSKTARLPAARMRRSSSARRPSSPARSARRSVSARAALSDAVWRAVTAHNAASSATNQIASQRRPLILAIGLPGGLERAELRRAGPHVPRHLGGARDDRLLGQHASQGAAATRADRLARRAHALPSPLAEQVFDDAVLARMVGNDPQAASRNEG